MSSSGKVVISNEQQYRIGDLVAHGAFSEVYKCYKLVNIHSHHHRNHQHKHEEQHQELEENYCHKRELEEEKLQQKHETNTHNNGSNINTEDDDNNEKSSATLAIKIVNKDLAVQHHMEEALIREVNTMEAVGYSPYVVHLIDRFISSSNYYIVMNYMQGGTLLEFIRAHRHHIDWTQATVTTDGNRQTLVESECKCTTNHKQAPEKETINTINETPSSLSESSLSELPFMWRVAPYFLKQLLLGLQHLYTHNVVHRDIKPENLLLNNDASELMISDFGFACYAPPNRTLHRTCGTLKYCAPELLVKKPRYDGRKVDIWAAGVTLYVMLCFTHPFKPTRNDADALLECILETSTSSLMLPQALPHAARDVLEMMLATDPQQRASIEELLAHPWLEQVELKNRHDNPSSATWHTAVKRKNDNDASVEPSITKKRRISESKCNAQTQVTSLANEMNINDDKLTHSSLSEPLAAQAKNSISELRNKKDIINGGEESHVNGNYCVNQCDITTTILNSNNRKNNKNYNNFTFADNTTTITTTTTTTNIICCNSSDSENDTSCYSQESISPDSMVSTDNGFYCSLHLSRVNTSDDVSGSNMAKLQSDCAEYNVNGLTQSSLEKEDSPQLTFLTPVSSNNEDTSHFPQHVTLRCNSCNAAAFADTTPFLLHTAVNEDMSECHGYDASKHIGTKVNAPCRREDNWRSSYQKRQTAALPTLHSITMIHGIFYLVLLLVYIQLFFLISCLSFFTEFCFNVRLSELQHPYWLRELLCYCTVPPLDRLNMWMSSSSSPLHAPNSHEWKILQQRIHKNKKESSASNRSNVDAGKDNAMHSAYGNADERIDKHEPNTLITSISEKLKWEVWKLFRYMNTTNKDQCLESEVCNHIRHENENMCASKYSNLEMPLCHNSRTNANIMRSKLQNSFCKCETVESSYRRHEYLSPEENKLDCKDCACILNQNARLQNRKVKLSTLEHQIEENKTNTVAKVIRKAVKTHGTANVIKNTKDIYNDILISEKKCQLETKKVSTYSNNNVKINTIDTNGAYSPTFPFPPARLSFNSFTVSQEDFPLSNVSINEASEASI